MQDNPGGGRKHGREFKMSTHIEMRTFGRSSTEGIFRGVIETRLRLTAGSMLRNMSYKALSVGRQTREELQKVDTTVRIELCTRFDTADPRTAKHASSQLVNTHKFKAAQMFPRARIPQLEKADAQENQIHWTVWKGMLLQCSRCSPEGASRAPEQDVEQGKRGGTKSNVVDDSAGWEMPSCVEGATRPEPEARHAGSAFYE